MGEVAWLLAYLDDAIRDGMIKVQASFPGKEGKAFYIDELATDVRLDRNGRLIVMIRSKAKREAGGDG